MPLTLDAILSSDNIAELLDEREADKILNDCEVGYKEDLKSRTDWSERQDDYMRLALQVVEQKNSPWPNAANVKYPLLTTATMQFGARAYPGLITGPQIVKGRVSGFDAKGQKAKSAERIGKHLSYQLIEEMDDWEEEMDKLCISIPIVGCMFKKTYFSPSKGKNVSELVYPKHLVVNYWTKTLKSSPRITHELHLSENDIYERVNSGIFSDIEYVKEYIEGDNVQNEVHGFNEPANSDSTPHLFKEQHTWLDLDGDGYKEPYIVTFGDGKLARIVACFDEEGIILNDDKVIRIERIEYFTKYGFVPSPDGSFYDIGFGLLLGPINDSINTTLNQLHDAGTLATRAGGFLGRGAKIKGGRHAFQAFEWQVLQSTGDDIRKNIFPLPVREPSPVLLSLLSLLIESGKELSSTVPMMMGQNPGQNQAATTSSIVIEEGMKVFSAIFKRLHRSLKSEVKKLKRLNRIYLPLESYFQVLDDKVDPETGVAGAAEKIWREDYSDDETDVQLYSDPNIVSQLQRTIKAQQIEQLMQGGHIPNPAAGSRIILEAMDLPNIEELMTPPEPQPNPEFELEKMKVQAEAQYKMGKLQGELAVMDAQVIGLEAKAMLDMAKAEAEENGTQIEIYKTQLSELTERRAGIAQLMEATEKQEMMEKADGQTDVQRVDGESGD